jgi:hypothetical protein
MSSSTTVDKELDDKTEPRSEKTEGTSSRPSESGTVAGVLISLASGSGNVTEPPSPPPQLPIQSLPPVLRNIVNKEAIGQPDASTLSADVLGVSSRITKDFFKRPHPHALSKELVFEILTSGTLSHIWMFFAFLFIFYLFLFICSTFNIFISRRLCPRSSSAPFRKSN